MLAEQRKSTSCLHPVSPTSNFSLTSNYSISSTTSLLNPLCGVSCDPLPLLLLWFVFSSILVILLLLLVLRLFFYSTSVSSSLLLLLILLLLLFLFPASHFSSSPACLFATRNSRLWFYDLIQWDVRLLLQQKQKWFIRPCPLTSSLHSALFADIWLKIKSSHLTCCWLRGDSSFCLPTRLTLLNEQEGLEGGRWWKTGYLSI